MPSPAPIGSRTAIARDPHGFVVTGADLSHDRLLDDWRLARVPYPYETSFPGVFAVGDVRSRSVKRVANAVGEGSAAIQYVHTYFHERDKMERAPAAAVAWTPSDPRPHLRFV